MDNIFEIGQAIKIGSVLTIFLFNKKYIVKPIDIFTEFLIRQSPRDSQTTYNTNYDNLLDGYNDLIIYGHTSAIECGTKLETTREWPKSKRRDTIKPVV